MQIGSRQFRDLRAVFAHLRPVPDVNLRDGFGEAEEGETVTTLNYPADVLDAEIVRQIAENGEDGEASEETCARINHADNHGISAGRAKFDCCCQLS
jgi:hypothetical protein